MIIATDVLLPGNRSEHYLANSEEELSDHICGLFLFQTMPDERFIYRNRRKDVCPCMPLQGFRDILVLCHQPPITGMGQFIFSTHNVLHLNLKTYMKEQIYFVTKKRDSLDSDLYSLSDFPEVRYETSKIYEFYMKGILGGTASE